MPSRQANEEDKLQYGAEDIDEKYPNRPRNDSTTLCFSELFTSVFNRLNEHKKKTARSKISPHEQRRAVIQNFIARWRTEVGNDFYPALRLILPDKDRDRGVYGLKEGAIGKLLVKLLKISPDSEDGRNLLKWKLPGQTFASRMAGDFAGRCFEILSKRQMRSAPGDMRIAEVNALLDKLTAASGEAEQLPILQTFYDRMDAEEMMWLIRIILKAMKVGASERTFLHLWHPDAEALFNVSSSLRRVCWELYDPELRLEQEDTGVTLMQCFQPQLAQFQVHSASFAYIVQDLRPTPEDPEFWIEEKLDGERMQMHMIEDDDIPGGKRFCFWSRKGKDYTYLYGNGLEDDNSALTRHLGNAFDGSVRNIILDGEMVTWDPKIDKMVAFGTLKTAALSGQKTPFDETTHRPLFRIFDVIYCNDQPLTRYTLRDRRALLDRVVRGVHRRFEIHPYEKATSPDVIEPFLRQIIADSSEGLVLKNPRSMYRLNSRNNDWLKVKPEYLSEFGESLDCIVIGGYFGSGHRGGTISSFLCGLRVSGSEKCLSFFKVGGGFRAEDYSEIRHLTEGKWTDWDRKRPPSEFIELGGGEKYQYEQPDVWIRPRDSIVISVKAASVSGSPQFAMGRTLRFPRFRRLRTDRSWDSALTVDDFVRVNEEAERQAKEKSEMKIEDRKRRPAKKAKRELIIAGQGTDLESVAPGIIRQQSETKIFEGLKFCILSESVRPVKKTKPQLEALVKSNGGAVLQQATPTPGEVHVIADKKVVKVASMVKRDDAVDIIRPNWILDCLEQGGGGFLLPLEERHLFNAGEGTRQLAARQVDEFGDSYLRDVGLDDLNDILTGLPRSDVGEEYSLDSLIDELGHLAGLDRGVVFRRCVVYLASVTGVCGYSARLLRHYILFGGGVVVDDLDAGGITHIVIISGGADTDRSAGNLLAEMRRLTSSLQRKPRIVTQGWVEDSWKEKTLLDEEGFVPQ